MNDINGSRFHLVENVADILSDQSGDEQLDTGEGADEDDDGGIAGYGSAHKPHNQGIDDEHDADDAENHAGEDAQLERHFRKGGNGGEGELYQLGQGVFALSGCAWRSYETQRGVRKPTNWMMPRKNRVRSLKSRLSTSTTRRETRKKSEAFSANFTFEMALENR